MNKYLTIGIIVAVLGLGFLFFGKITFGDITKQIAVPVNDYQNYRFFATSTDQTYYSTTTSALSTSITPYWTTEGRKDYGYFLTAGAKEITFFFTTTGTTTFSVDISDDGTNWYDYNYLRGNDVALTATTTYFLDGLTAAGTTAVVFMQDNIPYAVRCSVTTVIAGTKSCRASARW